MKEVFKDIKGYEGIYQVSDIGNVRSLDRFIKSSFRTDFKSRGRFIKKRINNKGYYVVNLNKESKSSTRTIHQLVAEAFLGHTPCGYDTVVDHIDNNSLNNKLTNIQLISNRENSSKDKKNGTSKYTGVHKKKNRKYFEAAIRFKGVKVFLGSFKSELDAHYQYELALDLINEIDDLTVEELKSI